MVFLFDRKKCWDDMFVLFFQLDYNNYYDSDTNGGGGGGGGKEQV